MSRSTSFHGSDEAGASWRALRLLAGALAGPLAWLTALEAAYVASYGPCDPGRAGHIHAALLVPLIVTLGAAALVWFTERPRPFTEDQSWTNTMAHAGLWLSLAFALLILTMYIPVAGLAPCV